MFSSEIRRVLTYKIYLVKTIMKAELCTRIFMPDQFKRNCSSLAAQINILCCSTALCRSC